MTPLIEITEDGRKIFRIEVGDLPYEKAKAAIELAQQKFKEN